jgi:hypothetical protein
MAATLRIKITMTDGTVVEVEEELKAVQAMMVTMAMEMAIANQRGDSIMTAEKRAIQTAMPASEVRKWCVSSQ